MPLRCGMPALPPTLPYRRRTPADGIALAIA
jgi:hypothetical protein